MRKWACTMLFAVCSMVTNQVYAQTIFYNEFTAPFCYQEGYGAYPTDTGYLLSVAKTCTGPNDWSSEMYFLDSDGDSVGSIINPPYNGFIRHTNDGNLLFLGGTRPGLTYDTIRIAKVNLSGDTLWTRNIFFPVCNNQVYDAVSTIDGGYIITGIYSTDSCQNVARYNAFVLKLNSQGQELWRKTFGTPLDDQLHSISEKPDGSLAAYGWAVNTNDSSAYQWLLNLSANGDSLSSQFFGNPLSNNYGYGMDVSYTGNHISIGYTDSIYISHVTNDGAVLFNKGIGVPSGGRYFQAMETSDLRFLFLACFDSPFGCESHLIKTERDGTIIWDKTWGGLMRRVDEPTPGRFILSGYKAQFPNPSIAQVVVFDTTVLPFDTTSIEFLSGNHASLKIYPNPANEHIFIDKGKQPIRQVIIYNSMGQQVNSIINNHYLTQLNIPVANLLTGIYYVQVITETGSEVRKVVVK